MIEANQKVFGLLDRYCTARGAPLKNAGTPRWIATEKDDRKFLKDAELTASLKFTAGRMVARFDHEHSTYFCTVGFQKLCDLSELVEERLNAGMFTATLAELAPRPTAHPDTIRNYVEASDKQSDRSYVGHFLDDIAPLFPEIFIYSSKSIADTESLRIFFELCLAEASNGDSWIDEALSQDLKAICSFDSLNLPYRTLCRSIFDLDPAALFLALYRCLEALYAFSSAQSVVDALKISITWPEMAVTLEKHLGWYPREEASLAELLKLATERDLREILNVLGETSEDISVESLPFSVGKRIYGLRNAHVHFRPAHQGNEYANIDWNRLCKAMVCLVFGIYYDVYR